MLFLILF